MTTTEESMVCTSCHNTAFTPIVAGYDFDTGKESFPILSCDQCHLAVTTPLLSENELNHYYHIEYYGSATKKFSSVIESWTVFSNNRLAAKLAALVAPVVSEAPKVLDIGCGRANLLKAFHRRGFQCFGIERANFPDTDAAITIYQTDFLQCAFDKNSLDLITIWHVLEHLQNPAQTVKKAFDTLKPGGKLVISVPNFGSLQSRLFGKHWFHLDLPRHTFHFTVQTLQAITQQAGFKIHQVSTNCLDQDIYGFIQSALNALFPKHPNLLFKALKSSGQKPAFLRKLVHMLFGGLITPFAVVAYVLFTPFNKGACITLYCEKPASN